MIKVLTTLIMVAALFVSGCGTTPKKVTYKTLAAVGAAVDNASDALVAGKIAGKVTDDEWNHAREVHFDFLRVYNQACNEAALGVDVVIAPADVIRLQLEFLNLVNSFLK